ncbi:MAG TPA: imidazole glycerol phosphate synthase subunit HisH [Caulobacteraceae bacterium]|nr:imidazole glycerol phosphate synthase subunit HisH [Caulobacteraceae bacterium]
MARVVALIDYGSGNLRSAEKALQRAAAGLADEVGVVATDDPALIARADAVVLPGVGAFSACRAALLDREGVAEAISEAVRVRGAPFLGICVGMQLMANRGLEFGETPGLGWIAGDVTALEPAERRAKVPHVGWNSVEAMDGAALFEGLPAGVDMYFTHSFAFRPRDEAEAIAWSDHGGRFAAAVRRGNLAGVQFHPEKSQAAGLKLLANFLDWRP